MEYPKFYVMRVGLVSYYRAIIDNNNTAQVCDSPMFPEISASEINENNLIMGGWQETTAEEFSTALNAAASVLSGKIDKLCQITVNVIVNTKQGLSTEPETKPNDAQTASDSPVN